MFKVNNKNTRVTSQLSLLLTLNICHIFFSVSVVEFEQATFFNILNVWVGVPSSPKKIEKFKIGDRSSFKLVKTQTTVNKIIFSKKTSKEKSQGSRNERFRTKDWKRILPQEQFKDAGHNYLHMYTQKQHVQYSVLFIFCILQLQNFLFNIDFLT